VIVARLAVVAVTVVSSWRHLPRVSRCWGLDGWWPDHHGQQWRWANPK